MGISANELRIGNLVDTVNHGNGITSPNKQPMWIQSIGLHSVELCNLNDSIHDTRQFLKKSLNDIIPIPLTAEWLLKFGFVNTESGYEFIIHSKRARLSVILRPDGIGMVGISGPFGLYDSIHYRYVHQLQNLYFSLCGKELEIV